MTPLSEYMWPLFSFGTLVGAIAGLIFWRLNFVGQRRLAGFSGAALIAVGAALLWSGPLGASERFAKAVEAPIRRMLVDYEMTQVSASTRRDPVMRQVVYSGPADELQRTELVRMAETLPGVKSATWNLKVVEAPLVAEGAFIALFGVLIGAIIAYLFELRRRGREEWSW